MSWNREALPCKEVQINNRGLQVGINRVVGTDLREAGAGEDSVRGFKVDVVALGGDSNGGDFAVGLAGDEEGVTSNSQIRSREVSEMKLIWYVGWLSEPEALPTQVL